MTPTRRRPPPLADNETPTIPVAAGARPGRPLMGLLGLGFWVQGFRCFPWMGMSFFLKDGLDVSPSALQLLQNTASIPMIFKPLYGLLSDAVPIAGQHRLPYISLGVLLQMISWMSIVILPQAYVTVGLLSLFLVLSNLGASVTEVANDAIVAKAAKNSPFGQLQSFLWIFAASGGVLGNLLGGYFIGRLAPTTIFLVFGLILGVQFLFLASVSEASLGLKKKEKSRPRGVGTQMAKLHSALKSPELSYSIAWFAGSFGVIPILMGTMFYYQTEHLKVDSSLIGLSKTVGQGFVLAWSLAYNKWLKEVQPRKLLSLLQVAIVALMISDVLFVQGIYRGFGFPDSLYVVLCSSLIEALFQCKGLPFTVLITQHCPAGCEGSLMAFVMSVIILSAIVGGYFGVVLVGVLGVSEPDFSGLPFAIVIQAACAALPIFVSSWIADDGRSGFAQFQMM